MLKTSKLLGRSLKLMSTGTAQAKIPESQKDAYYKTKEELSRIQHGKPEGWDQAKPFEQIPGPKPIPLLGNFWRFLPGIGEYSGVDAQELQFRLLQDYGDLVCLRGLPGRPPIVFLYNVKEMEILFKNEGVWPVRKSGDAAKYYREVLRNERFKGIPNLAVMNGEDWHNYRTLVNPVLMQPKVMKQYAPRLDPIASEFVDNMRIFAKQNPHKEMPADFINFINKMTLEAITLVAIDKRLGAMDPNLDKNSDIQKFINSVQDFFAILFKLEFLPSFWKIYPTKDFKRFVELLDFTADFVTKLIKEQAGKIKTEGPKNQQDMSVFEKLISVNENIAIAMSMDMIQAGVDSTSKQLSSILYYLAKNKEPQEKLRQELVRLLPQKDTQISSEILDQAQYLRAVIKETMRIAGAAAFGLPPQQGHPNYYPHGMHPPHHPHHPHHGMNQAPQGPPIKRMPTSIQVVLHELAGIPNRMGMLNKTDPYVVVKHFDAIEKTDVKKNAGSAARLDVTYNFAVRSNQFDVEIWDSGSKDTLIASKSMDLDAIGYNHRGWFVLDAKVNGCERPRVNIDIIPQ